MTGHYRAIVHPRPDGHWDVTIWGDREPPADVAYSLRLEQRHVVKIVRTEARARRAAARMIARCEKRHAAKYDRDSFTITITDTGDKP